MGQLIILFAGIVGFLILVLIALDWSKQQTIYYLS